MSVVVSDSLKSKFDAIAADVKTHNESSWLGRYVVIVNPHSLTNTFRLGKLSVIEALWCLLFPRNAINVSYSGFVTTRIYTSASADFEDVKMHLHIASVGPPSRHSSAGGSDTVSLPGSDQTPSSPEGPDAALPPQPSLRDRLTSIDPNLLEGYSPRVVDEALATFNPDDTLCTLIPNVLRWTRSRKETLREHGKRLVLSVQRHFTPALAEAFTKDLFRDTDVSRFKSAILATTITDPHAPEEIQDCTVADAILVLSNAEKFEGRLPIDKRRAVEGALIVAVGTTYRACVQEEKAAIEREAAEEFAQHQDSVTKYRTHTETLWTRRLARFNLTLSDPTLSIAPLLAEWCKELHKAVPDVAVLRKIAEGITNKVDTLMREQASDFILKQNTQWFGDLTGKQKQEILDSPLKTLLLIGPLLHKPRPTGQEAVDRWRAIIQNVRASQEDKYEARLLAEALTNAVAAIKAAPAPTVAEVSLAPRDTATQAPVVRTSVSRFGRR